MRDIRFRAYIKEFNKIFDVISIMTRKLDWEDFYRVFIEWEVKNYRIDWVYNILIAFTWLYDKNNIPIYEWDILKIKHCKDWEIIWPTTISTYNWIIIKNWSFLYMVEKNNPEIIWNKYIKKYGDI
jgi:hypothetical protein